jgi:hypothetical protein
MVTEPHIEVFPEDEARNPYGDVALGVECAWPESIPAVAAPEAEAA